MLIRITFFLLLSLVSACSTVSKHQSNSSDWSNYIPKSGITTADVMVLSASKETQLLGKKFQTGISKNKQWFTQYLTHSIRGKSLPYHKNFGLTKSEYRRYLSGLRSLGLVKKGIINLSFRTIPNGNVHVSGLLKPVPYDSLIYNPKLDQIIIGQFTLKAFSLINQTNKNSPTGRWKGKKWKHQSTQNNGDISIITFAIGSLSDKAKNIISYDIKRIRNNKKTAVNYILLYDK